ncbi:hypothetical protein C8J57DRAFT_1711726 [Mycena rebaudengoi]|nr:hypothetical protein C8J57DRAFT_1711726 [Mycena rebaudengoi]
MPSRNRSASNGRSTQSHIQERMTDLDAQILALEQAPDAVRLERPDLQTRLDVYKYPILTLPTEITSEIFVHFLPPYPERPPAIGLHSNLASLIFILKESFDKVFDHGTGFTQNLGITLQKLPAIDFPVLLQWDGRH